MLTNKKLKVLRELPHDAPGEWVLELINAVTVMREALEGLVRSEVIRTAHYRTYSEAYLNAEECLTELFGDTSTDVEKP